MTTALKISNLMSSAYELQSKLLEGGGGYKRGCIEEYFWAYERRC